MVRQGVGANIHGTYIIPHPPEYSVFGKIGKKEKRKRDARYCTSSQVKKKGVYDAS